MLRRSVSLRGLGEFVVSCVRHDPNKNPRNKHNFRNSSLLVTKVDAEVSAYCKRPATSPFGFFTDLSLSLQTEMTSRECTESRKVGRRAEVVYYISRKFFFEFEYMIFTRLRSDEET